MAANNGKSMKTFLLIWIGQVFSSVGSVAARFAIIWWIASLTGSATALATAAIMDQAPAVLLGTFAGALVDRWDRKRMLIVSDTLMALAALVLAALFWTGRIQVWHVFAVMLFRSVVFAFYSPAMGVVTTLLVPERHLTRVAGMNQMLQGGTNIIGPVLGALLLAWLPLHGIMLVDVVTAAIAVAPLLFVAVPRPAASARKQSVLADVRDGARYVRAWPGLVIALSAAVLANFLISPTFSLMPLLVKDHFGGGAVQLSWMESAMGVGIILGGLALSVWGGFKKKVQTMLVGVASTGAGILLIGLAPQPAIYAAVAGMFITGLSLAFVNGPMFALLQSAVATEMQGRVFGLVGTLSGIAAPLGLAVAGPVADVIGIQPMYVICSAAFLGMAALLPFARPLVRIEEDGARLRAANGAAQTA
jgi:DHA3 family macrolide efflux protein-like MFS transporter